MRGALVLVLTIAALASCKDKKTHYVGIGPWLVGKTTLEKTRDKALCYPYDDRYQCLFDRKWIIGKSDRHKGHEAKPQLYFNDRSPSAKLAELETYIRLCEPLMLKEWLITTFGEPVGEKVSQDHARYYWKPPGALVRVILRAKRCTLSFIDASDTKRVEQVLSYFSDDSKADASTSAKPASSAQSSAATSAALSSDAPQSSSTPSSAP